MIFDTEPSIEFLFNYTQVQFLLLLFRLRRCKLSLEGKEKKLEREKRSESIHFILRFEFSFFPYHIYFGREKLRIFFHQVITKFQLHKETHIRLDFSIDSYSIARHHRLHFPLLSNNHCSRPSYTFDYPITDQREALLSSPYPASLYAFQAFPLASTVSKLSLSLSAK